MKINIHIVLLYCIDIFARPNENSSVSDIWVDRLLEHLEEPAFAVTIRISRYEASKSVLVCLPWRALLRFSLCCTKLGGSLFRMRGLQTNRVLRSLTNCMLNTAAVRHRRDLLMPFYQRARRWQNGVCRRSIHSPATSRWRYCLRIVTPCSRCCRKPTGGSTGRTRLTHA